MGDIADMMINGDMDYETGEYIGPGQGFPRTMNGKKRKGFTRKGNPIYNGETSQLRGVKKYLKTSHRYISNEYMYDFCYSYLTEERGHEFEQMPPFKDLAAIISEDFGAFVKYAKEKRKEYYEAHKSG